MALPWWQHHKHCLGYYYYYYYYYYYVAAAHDNDVRSARPRSGVPSDRQPVWNGLPRTQCPRTESVHRQLVDPAVWRRLSLPRQTTAALWYLPRGQFHEYDKTVSVSKNVTGSIPLTSTWSHLVCPKIWSDRSPLTPLGHIWEVMLAFSITPYISSASKNTTFSVSLS